jgi:ribosomal protein S18 acetylase RimI-like enzyme
VETTVVPQMTHADQALHVTSSLETPERYAEAAQVLYDGFKMKIERLEFFPHDHKQAQRLLVSGMNPRRGLYALHDSKVIGVAGLEYGGERLMRIPKASFVREFGLVGGLARYLWTRFLRLFQRPDPQVLRLEMIAVSPAARGLGVGTALVESVCELAQALGYRMVVLEVVNTNPRAKALYERLGFKTVKHSRYGILTRRAGFTGAYKMQRDL